MLTRLGGPEVWLAVAEEEDDDEEEDEDEAEAEKVAELLGRRVAGPAKAGAELPPAAAAVAADPVEAPDPLDETEWRPPPLPLPTTPAPPLPLLAAPDRPIPPPAPPPGVKGTAELAKIRFVERVWAGVGPLDTPAARPSPRLRPSPIPPLLLEPNEVAWDAANKAVVGVGDEWAAEDAAAAAGEEEEDAETATREGRWEGESARRRSSDAVAVLDP